MVFAFRELDVLQGVFYMGEISAKYFSTKFIVENKLKLTDIVILEYIYSWILSDNPPEFKTESGKKAFYLSQSHIVKDYNSLITQSAISQKMKRFEKCGIINTTIIDSTNSKFYVCFNWEKVIESLAPKDLLDKQKYKYCSNWFEKIFKFMEEEKNNENEWKEEWKKKSLYERIEYYKNEEEKWKMENEQVNKHGLLNESDMQASKKYCVQADLIAKRILLKYGNLFNTRFPSNNDAPTKTYIRLCNKITDIYNGHFVSSRYYNFDENVFKNKQFVTEGWKEKILEAKGDWKKVKKLIFDAIKNFEMMFDESRMPMNKNYLTNNLSNWFFSDNPNSKGQSQFIQSLNEPQIIKHKLGEDKAKKIVEDLKKNSPVSYLAGHELNELLPANANESMAWESIRKIIEWGKLLWQFEPNSKYFLECEIDGNLESGPKVLPALFARYLVENHITVSLATLDIEKSVENNAPWSWFISKACKVYEMNNNFMYCFESNDFYDASNSPSELNDVNIEW